MTDIFAVSWLAMVFERHWLLTNDEPGMGWAPQFTVRLKVVRFSCHSSTPMRYLPEMRLFRSVENMKSPKPNISMRCLLNSCTMLRTKTSSRAIGGVRYSVNPNESEVVGRPQWEKNFELNGQSVLTILYCAVENKLSSLKSILNANFRSHNNWHNAFMCILVVLGTPPVHSHLLLCDWFSPP